MGPQTNPLSMQELLSGNVQLASPPEIFLRISEIIDDPSKNAHHAEQVIQHDPGLCARLLRLANSAFYGFSSKISSVSHAIAIIGTQELRDLILATVVIDKFSTLPNGLMTMRQFWSASVRCALFSRNLAHFHPRERTLQSVFICGLLHEVGRLIIYHHIPELSRAAISLTQSEGLQETEAEYRIIGFTHYDVAAELAKRWRLPEVIIVTIKNHNAPEKAALFDQETALISLASLLSLKVDLEDALSDRQIQETPLWDFITLPRDILKVIIPEVDVQFREVFHALFFA